MLPVLAFALVAGILTILAPCTLPVVPLVLGASSGEGRLRTTGLLLGFGLTFVAVTVIFASLLAAAGLTSGTLRLASAVLLAAVGMTLVVPRLAMRAGVFLGPVARVGSRIVASGSGTGFGGGLVLGGAIGLIWAPCVGPIMAAVIAVATTRGPSVEAVLIALAYVAGAAIPLGLIAAWGRRATRPLRAASGTGRLQRSFGVVMILSTLLVVSGLDLTVENGVAGLLPVGWSGVLISPEQYPAVQAGLEGLEAPRVAKDSDGTASATPSGGAPSPGAPGLGHATALPTAIADTLPSDVALQDLGAAPEFDGISAWINTSPLTIASLRNKVVLVEFWTFECINCIHVQPYVKAWYERYASAGLVVIGVHTPELSFERDLGNVRAAVTKSSLQYPIAFDPSFATWNAYRNSYWPAFYFIDRTGQIRHVHFGEGDYDGSEQVIRQLLSQPG